MTGSVVETIDVHSDDGRPSWQRLDGDGDGIDAGDNCPLVANADQADADADGIGDACDPSLLETEYTVVNERFVSTDDSEGDGATADDPIETFVESPTLGVITISEGKGAGSGFALGGWQVNVTAPDATAGPPLRITFRLDASLIPAGTPVSAIAVTRNGVPVADCAGPDPCVERRTLRGDGDVEVVVLTSRASAWELGLAGGGDTEPPLISCGAADGQWHAANVAIDCTAHDAGSGLADPADAAFSLSTAVPDESEDATASTGSRTVCDTAGNCATAGPIAGNRIDRKAPALQLPANAIVDATSPAGAVGTYPSSASDGADPHPQLSCVPASGATFPIGETPVTCTATDHVGNSATGSFVVTVRGAPAQIVALVQKTLAMLNHPLLEAALQAQLENAAATLIANNKPAACGALNVYIAAVRLQSGRALTAAQATELITDARRIRAVIGC